MRWKQGGRIALFLLSLAVPFGLVAAGTKITGTVVDSNGEPAAGTRVELVPSSEDQPTLKTKTKKKGKFFFAMVRQGQYSLEFEAEGQRVAEVEVVCIDRDGHTTFEFAGPLKPGSPMPEFNVTDTDEVTYDVKLAPSQAGSGSFGTGVALKEVDDLAQLIQSGRASEARAELARSLEVMPDDPKLHYLLAFLEMNEGRVDPGLDAIARAQELDPAFPGAALLEGALLEESGNDDGALESYRRELQVATDDRVRHDAWVRIAMLCDRMGREECADEALTELIALDPADGTAYAQLIDRYVRHEEFAKVQELMANAPDDVQNDVTIHYNIGAGLWNQGDAAAAVPSLERVLELRPDMADAHRLLGFCKVSSSELEEAAEHFARYLELAPDAPDAAATRAVLAQVQEKIANAGN